MSETKWKAPFTMAKQHGTSWAIFDANHEFIVFAQEEPARRIVAALEDQAAMAAKIERVRELREVMANIIADEHRKGDINPLNAPRLETLNTVLEILEAKQNP